MVKWAMIYMINSSLNISYPQFSVVYNQTAVVRSLTGGHAGRRLRTFSSALVAP